MAKFVPKPWTNPMAYIAPPQKKDGKMANFGPKPWTIPFSNISIFRLFELLVFIALKGGFSFYNIRKYTFPNCFAQTNKDGKMANFWTKTMDYPPLSPLDKAQFFDSLNVLVL